MNCSLVIFGPRSRSSRCGCSSTSSSPGAQAISFAKEDWKPCQISPEALIRLKLAATLTGREQRELATQAVITFCTAILTRKLGKDVNHEHLAVALEETLKLKKKKKL